MAALLLAACASGPPAGDLTPPAAAAVRDPAAAEARQLHQLFDAYFETRLELFPLLATSIGDSRYDDRFEVQISPGWIRRFEQIERDALAQVSAIDRSRLPTRDQLSCDVFRSAREHEIAGFRFPDEQLPLNQFFSVPNSFAQLGSGKGIHRFRTVRDYENFLKRMDDFAAWTEQARGAQFDLRRFHTEVLVDGALPLDVFEANVDRWIAAGRGV